MTTQDQKYLKIGIGVLAIGVVRYFVLAKNDNGGETEDPTGNGGVGDAGAGSGAFNPHSTATLLWDAMKDSGTDEDAVISILGRVSNSQFKAVSDAFGVLAYNMDTGNQYFAIWQTVTRYPLKDWLKSELSAAEYINLRRKYPNYL